MQKTHTLLINTFSCIANEAKRVLKMNRLACNPAVLLILFFIFNYIFVSLSPIINQSYFVSSWF
jgi:hypothetical protein